MRLMREMRGSPVTNPSVRGLNSWAGPVELDKSLPFWKWRITVDGPIDPITGYLCDIKMLDSILKQVVVPIVADSPAQPTTTYQHFAQALLDAQFQVINKLPKPLSLHSLELMLTPYLWLRTLKGDRSMVQLTRTFEFSAAHRLYVADYSEEKNRRIFGKCSNPHGHGHNYVLEVSLRGTPSDIQGILLDPPQFDHLVKEVVLDHFDHKNLNVECEEFTHLNPSVENIARVIWQRLEKVFAPGQLDRVRVWETAKTYADYDGRE